jgi:hypothetical protein
MGLIQDDDRKFLLEARNLPTENPSLTIDSISFTAYHERLADSLQRAKRQEQMMVIGGVVLVISLGLLLGFATPTSSDLTATEGRISNILGWTYFAAWSLSFYPQVSVCFWCDRRTLCWAEICLAQVEMHVEVPLW